MKKKMFKILLSVAALSTLLLGCTTTPGPQGEAGSQGETGPQGPAGNDGVDGKDGVSVVSIVLTSSDGLNDTYTITYSNGTTSTFVVTNGADGQQGIQGNPGEDGHTPVITIGTNGNWFVDGIDTGIVAQGPKGDQGEKGADGTMVLTGHGEPNSNLGKEGDSYIDLDTWDYFVKINNVWVKQGNIKGDQGAAGNDGVDGQNGISVVSITLTSTDGLVDTYTITYSNGSTSTFTVTNGAQGDQGIQGNPGKDGHTPVITIGTNGNWYVDGVDTGIKAQGEKGDQGETGVSIVNTYIDENGDLIVEFSDGTSSNAGHVKDTDMYTVNFWVGEELITTKQVLTGTKVSRPTAEETAGYTITDWYCLDGTMHESWKFIGYVVTENLDLYAEFECNEYTITFIDETHGHSVSPINVQYNHSYTLPSISEVGYTFNGWKDVQNNIWNDGVYRLASSLVLFAVWDANTYQVTLDPNAGTVEQDSLIVTYDSQYTLPTPTKPHYHFLGWFDGETRINDSDTWQFTENKTLVARWEIVRNTYHFDAGDGTCGTDSITIEWGEEYTLPIPTPSDPSRYFIGWNLNGSIVPYRGTWTYSDEGGTFVASYVDESYPVNISDGVVMSVKSTFEGGEIILPVGVTRIGYRAFENCVALTSIVIPDSVTSIGSTAFSGCDGLTSIVIPDSVTSIEEKAFYDCSNLVSINIPNGITSINDETFFSCVALEGIDLPNSVSSIGEGAFSHCRGFTSVVLPDIVTSIGSTAFNNCTKLTSINIPSGITTIERGCFVSCPLETIELPEGLVSIGDSAFDGLASDSINIPDGVTYIGSWNFGSSYNLESVVLPNSLTTINEGIFFQCECLTSVTIKSNVTQIDRSAFGLCQAITEVNYTGTMEQWNAIERVGTSWVTFYNVEVIHCSDGDLPFDALNY